MLSTTKYGNVDCRAGIPNGYQVVYGMLDDNSLGSERRCRFWEWIEENRIEYHRALMGFKRVESQHFPRAHFSKPAHWKPVEEVIVSAEAVIPEYIYHPHVTHFKRA